MNKEALVEQLERLRAEHEVLNSRIDEMTSGGVYDDIRILRLKKRKLAIRDQIGRIESDLVPDIIA
ncbi:MAG TPA: DUF465 domain-containing protein [Alphaproteobacteria bacterium]